MYQYTLGFTARTWPGISEESVADCVGDAVERTMSMWVHWRGSVVLDDPALTLAGAKRHACMWAHKLLKQEQMEYGTHTMNHGHDKVLTGQAAAVLAELQEDEREWELWARDWLEEGLSERETAVRENVTHQAIHQRRTSGMARIAPLLRRHHLIGGTT